MLRRDASARFVQSGSWIFSRYRFETADFEASNTLSRGAYARLQHEQAGVPVLVLDDEDRRRRWWLFRDEFYWEDDGYEAHEVKALVLERLGQRDRRLRRAVALMEQGDIEASNGAREAIPDAVRAFVWNRDGGRCVRCGSNERLEFDHVIPLALGGANTARNLQLLCETCNRQKGASIV